MTASLAVVIVSFNTRDHLARCLDTLASHPPRPPLEIVVVDNGSSDGSADLVARAWPAVRLLRNTENVGFARGSNQGIRATTSDLVLLLNSDTIPPAGAIDALRDVLLSDPRAAAAGPRLVDEDGWAELSFGRMMSPLNELRQKTLVRLAARGPSWIRRRVQAWTRAARHVDWVSGACLMVRRQAAEAAGLLDERFFMYGEDVDFCAALRARGDRILFTPAAEVVHLRGQSRATSAVATTAAYRRSQIAFYEKHHPRWASLLRSYLRLCGKLPSDR